jgi:hypothetical protein
MKPNRTLPIVAGLVLARMLTCVVGSEAELMTDSSLKTSLSALTRVKLITAWVGVGVCVGYGWVVALAVFEGGELLVKV